MENKDIILFILVMCVLYLILCDNKKNKEIKDLKESFTNNATGTESVTESIKNLGCMAKKIQNANGDFTFPANLKVPGNLDITGKLNLLPQGTIVMWTGNNPPTGWWECNGQHVSGYGNVPDFRGRFLLGSGKPSANNNNSGTWDGVSAGYPNDYHFHVGKTSGEWRHQLSKEEMPSHTHELKRPIYRSWFEGSGEEIITHEAGFVDIRQNEWNGDVNKMFKSKINPKGNNQAHNNMPPYYIVMYIIKIY